MAEMPSEEAMCQQDPAGGPLVHLGPARDYCAQQGALRPHDCTDANARSIAEGGVPRDAQSFKAEVPSSLFTTSSRRTFLSFLLGATVNASLRSDALVAVAGALTPVGDALVADALLVNETGWSHEASPPWSLEDSDFLRPNINEKLRPTLQRLGRAPSPVPSSFSAPSILRA
ncbi:hypothetical protein T484DRAFT_1895075 [Baffinella frigidus]|nr:hypothetical protein T484DRAFT_1895075 [Cryptophyta sp. CCMP2293]